MQSYVPFSVRVQNSACQVKDSLLESWEHTIYTNISWTLLFRNRLISLLSTQTYLTHQTQSWKKSYTNRAAQQKRLYSTGHIAYSIILYRSYYINQTYHYPQFSLWWMDSHQSIWKKCFNILTSYCLLNFTVDFPLCFALI